MSTKYVTDTAAGKSISAYVVLDKTGKEVATIRAHFSNGGACLVNVFNMDGTPFQSGKASGYGYDKFTAALSGLIVAGIKLSDHCGRDEKAAKLGATFANWNRDDTGFSSLHIASGLDRLKMAGYKVIQAI